MLQARDCDSLYVELCHGLVQGGLRSARVRICDPETEELVTVAYAGEPTTAERAVQPHARMASGRVRRLRSVTSPQTTAGFPLLCSGQPVALLEVEAYAAEALSAATLDLLEKLARNLSLVLDDLEDQRHKQAAERVLLDNAIRFRDAAGAAGEYVWEVDLDGRFTYLSDGIETISGYRPEDLVGRTPIELMPEQDRGRVRDWVAQNVGADGSFRDFEHQLVSRHGEARWVRVSAVGLLDANGKRVGQRGTGRDITERRRAEQHLAESRKFLDELINAVPDPISVKDAQHRFVAVNHAFCRIVGCTREELLGKDDAGLIPARRSAPGLAHGRGCTHRPRPGGL